MKLVLPVQTTQVVVKVHSAAQMVRVLQTVTLTQNVMTTAPVSLAKAVHVETVTVSRTVVRMA